MANLKSWLNNQPFKPVIVDNETRGMTDERSESNQIKTAAISLISLLDRCLSSKFYFISNMNESHHSGDTLSPIKSKNEANSRLPVSSFSNGKDVHESGDSTLQSPTELSVFGSPLKMQEIADLDHPSLNYSTFNKNRKSSSTSSSGLVISQQLSLKEGQQLLQKFVNMERNKAACADSAELPTMLAVFCNSADVKKTLLVGTEKKAGGNSSRAKFCSFHLSMDKVPMSSIESVSELKGKSYAMTACYELLDVSLGLGHINLTAKWRDSKGRPQLTTPLSTEFILDWATVVGSELSPVFGLYTELQKVSGFVNNLKNEDLTYSCETQENSVLKLKDVFTQLKTGSKNNQSSEPPCLQHLVEGSQIGRIALSPDCDRDFTDDLWGVLAYCCSDLTQMTLCFKETFTQLKQGHLSPYVRGDNTSTMANLVRAAASGLAVFPPLSLQLSLRLVAEIGLERLKKTYYTILVSANELWTQGQWDERLKVDSQMISDVDEDISSLLNRLSALEKIHTCLESVAVLDVSTENFNLSKIATTVMRTDIVKGAKGCVTVSGQLSVTAALAVAETKKHDWSSIRRERVDRVGVKVVETFQHVLPTGLIAPSGCEAGEILKFTARHHTL